jgi:hypothetical protein
MPNTGVVQEVEARKKKPRQGRRRQGHPWPNTPWAHVRLTRSRWELDFFWLRRTTLACESGECKDHSWELLDFYRLAPGAQTQLQEMDENPYQRGSYYQIEPINALIKETTPKASMMLAYHENAFTCKSHHDRRRGTKTPPLVRKRRPQMSLFELSP